MGICTPVIAGFPTVLTSPVSFLQRPARWMQILAASYPNVFTSAPNFAFDFAARKTSDEDMAGLDLGDVLLILSGSGTGPSGDGSAFHRSVCPLQLLRNNVMQPSYGLAEATLYVATPPPSLPPQAVYFDTESLTTGASPPHRRGRRHPADQLWLTDLTVVPDGADRRSGHQYRVPRGDDRRDLGARRQCQLRATGANPRKAAQIFHAKIVEPSAGTPEGPWLKTGDLGFISEINCSWWAASRIC